jgi:DNA modification methylase
MQTHHDVILADAARLAALPPESIQLAVTSPPYPMIAMWDRLFLQQSPAARRTLERGDGMAAFEAMHRELDRVWEEVHRVLIAGGLACINIGDATRTVGERFALYPNHVRVMQHLLTLGFTPLPCILWRKPTNAPTKFMGSGMLPAGAYVTLEHEYILIVRKGPKRAFATAADRQRRRESAIFWEERNQWYSDVWLDLRGTPQGLGDGPARKRSAAFPFEVAHRLINMYSVKGDVVLDPFLGTGTTMAAAMATGRSSVGFEIDPGLGPAVDAAADALPAAARGVIRQRLDRHLGFINQRRQAGGELRYRNVHYGFAVVTAQERDLLIPEPVSVATAGPGRFEVAYAEGPGQAWAGTGGSNSGPREPPAGSGRTRKKARPRQGLLFDSPGVAGGPAAAPKGDR